MKKNKKLISIVIPVYNEEENIPRLGKELTSFINNFSRYRFEIIFVEHGSVDRSFNLLENICQKDKRFKILQLSRNFGGQGGIVAGIHFATGEACVILMADMQEPIELIRDFTKKWEEGYQIVYGVVKKRTANWLNNFCSVLFYKILNLFSNIKFPENVSDFRLMDKKVYQTINRMPEKNKYLRGLIAWTGFKYIGIPFNRRSRVAGKSKADFPTLFKIALDALFSFSYLPLRFISILGFLIMSVSFILIVYYFTIYFLNRDKVVPGLTTITLLIISLFGLLFFALGIISEYLSRIYEDLKQRPEFIVKDKINLN